jgi:signal transduction histidine kinase
MRLALYNVRRKTDDARLTSHINSIDNKIIESEQIINNLVFYARIKTPQRKPVNICDLIESAIEEAVKQHPRHAWTLTKDMQGVKCLVVDVDGFQIKEVITNILNNAYDATDPGMGRISIGAKVVEGTVAVCVEDNGQGIDERHLPRIFDPFFTTKTKGTGLGLSLSRQIMTQHHGSIVVASRKGEGTTVTVTLPIKAQDGD